MRNRIIQLLMLLTFVEFISIGCTIQSSTDVDNSYEKTRNDWCMLQYISAGEDEERQTEVIEQCWIWPAIFGSLESSSQ